MQTTKFKQLLIEKKISQRKLAEELNLSAKNLNLKVNGKIKFKVDEAIKICDILGIEDIRKYFN